MKQSKVAELIELVSSIFGPTVKIEFSPVEGGYQRIHIFDLSTGQTIERISAATCGHETDYNEMSAAMITKILTTSY